MREHGVSSGVAQRSVSFKVDGPSRLVLFPTITERPEVPALEFSCSYLGGGTKRPSFCSASRLKNDSCSRPMESTPMQWTIAPLVFVAATSLKVCSRYYCSFDPAQVPPPSPT